VTSSAEGKIHHISNTAFIIAASRARETELDDLDFRDPFSA
jgi:hypothetical protein